MGARIEGMRGLRRRLDQVRDTATDEGRLARFLDALTEKGAGVARARFNAAKYPGVNNVSVTVVRDSATAYRVVASGRSVMFIEFGSGVIYAHDNPATPAGWGPGSWSETHANRIGRHGYWVYYGAPGGDAQALEGRPGNTWLTRGNPSANAMYEASKDMRRSIADAWATAFGSNP